MRTEAEVDSLHESSKFVMKPSQEQHWRGGADRYRALVGGRDSEKQLALLEGRKELNGEAYSKDKDKECLSSTKRTVLDHLTKSDHVQQRILT